MKDHELVYIDLLKVDIEGNEWDVFRSMLSEYDHRTVPFNQLLIELHYRYECMMCECIMNECMMYDL